MRRIYLTLSILLVICGISFAQTTLTFNYTGALQTWVVPPCVIQVTVTVDGGAGGTGGETSNNSQDIGGEGGSVVGVLNVTAGNTLNIYVGGQGVDGTPGGGGGVGGWNGGGFALQGYFAPPPWLWFGGGGGGASDIRVGGVALANRVVVGGGGGGAGFNYFACCNYDQGGPGGGLTGQAGWSGNVQGSGGSGYGGSQVAGGTGGGWGGYCTCTNGTLGLGSNDCVGGFSGNAGGGGGGGYYGGGAGCWSGGGGGSSYVGGLASVISNTQGVRSGNGLITITYVSGGPPLSLSTTFTDPTCGNCNGSANVVATGGNAPYTYLWTPGNQSNATATGLCNGTYTITVHDACGDIATSTVTLTSTSITVNATVTADETCNGSCVGSALSTIIGGSAPFTYTWTPSGGSNAAASNLCAGTYTVSVRDANGCTGTASVNITQPALLTAPITVTNVLCFGGTGSETCAPLGGTGPYHYSWHPSAQTNATATGLTAGSYTVTVTDANGCTATNSASISQPAVLAAHIGATTYPACNGGTGTSTVSGTGGTPTYTYNWTPAGGTNANATGLSAGTYAATITDANGCTASVSVVISQPTVLTATMGTPTNPLCNGAPGSVTVTAGGGTPGYSYIWTPSGGTNANASITAGTYSVTVTDHDGCTATASVTINQPAALSTTISFTPASCNLPNGSATVVASGGVPNYTYVWIPSAETTATATGLNAGTYTVTVTDNNHCTTSTSVTVTQPPAVTATISGNTPVSCNAGTNGTATAVGGGGTPPYNYLWTPGSNTNAYATGLSAGTYSVTVTDANNCTASAATTIIQPAPIVVSVSGPFQLCQGSSGDFTANVTGGTAPYNYAWSSGATTSIANLAPATPQTYTVDITDANGCTATGVVAITFGTPLLVTTTGATSICSGTPTTLCANISGGTGGDTYTWTPGNLTSACVTVTPNSTTTYTVTVKDNCGAIISAFATVHVNQYPSVAMSADIYTGCTPLCIQFRNNSTIQGGAGSYVWAFGNGDTLQAESPIYCYPKSGTFNVTLTVTSDSGGCSSTLNKQNMITVYTHPNAAFSFSPQMASILAPTVQFTDNSKDQYGIVSHAWRFGDATDSNSNLTNPAHTYQDTGTYCASLVVMNQHGCVDTATNCLVINPAFNLYIPSGFTPNGDGVNDVFQPVGKYIKSFEMYIFDRWGAQVYHTTDITKGWTGSAKGSSAIVQEDTYIYKIMVTDSQGNQHSYVGNVSLIK